jgi:hypothetical protein
VRPRGIVIGSVLSSALLLACALGDEDEPGCRSDGECDVGFVCRAGACFRYTTEQSPPHDPADARDDRPDASGDTRAD